MSGQIGMWISILSRFQQLNMSRMLGPMGIGYGQYPLLITVCKQPGIRQDRLADFLFLNKSSVARGVAQLEHGGFLRRAVDAQDKRAYHIFPTPQATDMLDEILRQCRSTTELLTAGLTDEETAQLGVLLQRAADTVIATKTQQKPKEA